MKTKLIKDKKKRQLLQTYEKKRILLKQILRNELDLHQENAAKEKVHQKLHKLPRNSSRTRVKNRCILTGRGRSPLRKFKISRLEFRRKAAHGFLPGVTKTSWLQFILN